MENFNEEAAVETLKKYVEGDLYILLSTVSANMMAGLSIPFIGQMDDGKILFLFSDLEYAKKYCVDCGYEVLDGIYPLSKIDKNNLPANLEMIAKIASHLGVTHIDFNPCHETDGFGVTIPWMQKVLNYDLNNISVIMSQAEMKKMMEENGGKAKAPLRFNPMPILGFSNPYVISPERKKQIDEIPLKTDITVGQFVDILKFMPLTELIYLSETINRKYIAKAKQENDKAAEKMLGNLFGVLDQVIIHVLTRLQLYTLLDNGETYIAQNRVAYVLYTDRFKYMGDYRYLEIDLKDFCDELESKGINSLIITAGPGEMHLSSVAAIREYMKANNI